MPAPIVGLESDFNYYRKDKSRRDPHRHLRNVVAPSQRTYRNMPRTREVTEARSRGREAEGQPSHVEIAVNLSYDYADTEYDDELDQLKATFNPNKK